MRFLICFLLIIYSLPSFSEVLKPSPELKAIDVIKIQLEALKQNNSPYENAGIEQTWEFAHPSNRIYTGPLTKFINMMNTPSYRIMLNHKNNQITKINENENMALFIIELEIDDGSKFAFQWIVEKFLNEGKFKNCWMTISVSQPIPITESA